MLTCITHSYVDYGLATHTHDVPVFSSPVFSTFAIWSHVFQSCVIHFRVFSVPSYYSCTQKNVWLRPLGLARYFVEFSVVSLYYVSALFVCSIMLVDGAVLLRICTVRTCALLRGDKTFGNISRYFVPKSSFDLRAKFLRRSSREPSFRGVKQLHKQV